MEMQYVGMDDGSTQSKLAWLINNTIRSKVVPNSLRKGWQSAALRSDYNPSNWILDGKKYCYDITAESSIDTQHVDYQFSDECLISVHHALQQTDLDPKKPVTLIATLPIGQFYDPETLQRNEDQIERKRQNLMRPVTLNGGTPFDVVDCIVMPESAPAVLTHLIEADVSSFHRTLVIDVGGTSVDMCLVRGKFEEISSVRGFDNMGVSWVTQTAKNSLAEASSDASWYVTNELIKNRKDPDFVKQVVNDHSKIDMVLERIEQRCDELSDAVAKEAKRFCQSPNLIVLVGGGSNLCLGGIQEAYTALEDRIILKKNAQTSLSIEALKFHLASLDVSFNSEDIEEAVVA